MQLSYFFLSPEEKKLLRCLGSDSYGLTIVILSSLNVIEDNLIVSIGLLLYGDKMY